MPDNLINDGKLEKIKRACALVEVKTEKGTERGTGYLISQNLLMTCEHVVRNVSKGHKVKLIFETNTTNANVVGKCVDRDCAILKLDSSIEIEPLRFAKTPPSIDSDCMVYGFPKETRQTGRRFTGKVNDPNGKDTSELPKPAIDLYFSSVKEDDIKGLSGGPVLVNDLVVGHLKRFWGKLEDPFNPDSRMVVFAGALYATRGKDVLDFLRENNSLPCEEIVLSPELPGNPYNSVWYIERKEEEGMAMNKLRSNSSSVTILGPPKFGKSYFLEHLLELIKKDKLASYTIVRIEMNIFYEAKQQTLDEILKIFARVLVDSVGKPQELILDSWKHSDNPLVNIGKLMENCILPSSNERLFLIIEKTDRIASWKVREPFLDMLRSWLEKRDSSVWKKFRLILTLFISPSELTEDPNTSPLNNSLQIRLKDFDKNQILSLAKKYQLILSEDEIKGIMGLVGGHPFLLRLIMYHAKEFNKEIIDLLNPATDNDIYQEHLEFFSSMLEKDEHLQKELQRFKDKNEDTIPSKNQDACKQLVNLGLLKKINKGYKLSRRLYERLID